MIAAPDVAAEPPPGWATADVAPPPLGEGTRASVTQWRAARGPHGVTWVTGCIAAPVPGWVEDMRPAIEARTLALAGATAGRVAGVPVDARPGPEGTWALVPAGATAPAPLGTARTFLGFDPERVFGCFALCAAPPDAVVAPECDRIAGARLEGGGAPPPPGLVLGATSWAVHHPRTSGGALAGLAVAAGLLAVLTRPRPRSRA